MNKNFKVFLQKIRAREQINMKKMAVDLDIHFSYLSVVECGKRRIPKTWKEKIVTQYQLSNEDQKQLERIFIFDELDIDMVRLIKSFIAHEEQRALKLLVDMLLPDKELFTVENVIEMANLYEC